MQYDIKKVNSSDIQMGTRFQYRLYRKKKKVKLHMNTYPSCTQTVHKNTHKLHMDLKELSSYMLIGDSPVKHAIRMIKPSILKTEHIVWKLPHQIEQDKAWCRVVGAIQKLGRRHFFTALLKDTVHWLYCMWTKV
jgi:hypothetical protein